MAEYIEREAAIKATCENCTEQNIYRGSCADTDRLRAIPAADVVEVVRCKDCKYSAVDFEDRRYCKLVTYYNHVPDDWFCADGEKRSNDA